NAIGTSPPSVASAPVTPSATPAVAFVQQTGTQQSGITSATVTLPAPLGSGHRLVVEVGAWSATGAVTSGVTDAAGDPFVEVAHWKGSDGTEASVWTAPVTSGGGQTPTITAHTSAPADVGVDALEYAGLSTVDTVTTASGTTAAATTVHSGQTAPAAAGGELALGVYADSGFGHALTG